MLKRTITPAVIFTALIGFLAASAQAVPVQGRYLDIAGACDDPGPRFFQHEIGDIPAFPLDEGIISTSTPWLVDPAVVPCAPDDGVANDWLVTMTNVSPFPYADLFFVADLGYKVGNFDGEAEDLAFPGFTDAFRIDGTVTPGVNNPLLFEGGVINEVFSPGETWEFVVVNFTGGPPVFDSAGAFSASSALTPPSNASILARQVPEPATLGLLIIGAAVIGARGRRSTNAR